MNIKKLWYRSFTFLITLVYFRKIKVYGTENINGPVLFIGLHKNGAVDGFVYNRALNSPTFLIAAQLKRNPIISIFFDGIEVSRDKDKEKRNNIAALKQCISILENEGKLFVFPEGTSTLGPTHLPFKEGAAILASHFDFSKGKNLTVIPCAVFYDDPTNMGGKVEILTGKPIMFSQKKNREDIQNIFTKALENIGIDYDSAEQQNIIQKSATLLTLYGDIPYHIILRKIYEDKELFKEAEQTLAQLPNNNLLLYKGIPVFPKSVINSLWTFFIATPFVIYAFIWNCLPVIAGYICAKKFPDDINVISLWKIIPSFTLWLLLSLLGLIFFTKLTILSSAISLLGFIIYGAWKKHTFALCNTFKTPESRKQFNLIRTKLYEKFIQ